ncbi:MAG TPA: YqaJ viral recombinase family protein [Elusimicrobiota bacterium]|jgi:hypothetical protein|nr:YqaJ viral recombinase family protein [Elusimicrobiota bacterium]
MEEKLRAVLDGFVRRHAGVRQRGTEWYRAMGETVGGSELAAVMGRSPYSSLHKVAADKVAALQGRSSFEGGAFCWWGSLFQDVAAAVVELDLGARVVGDDICVREVPGHRNSPDGYILARVVGTPSGLRLWSTDQDPPTGATWAIVLLEIKCPASRLPQGRVPRHYVPQLWSGLAVSPAHFGLFVDAVFRKCSLEQLGPDPDYDAGYHGPRDVGRWEGAFAWGVIGVYAPAAPETPTEPAGAEPGSAGGPPAERAEKPAAREPIDLGRAGRGAFDEVLRAIDQKLYRVVREPPSFADGRGAQGDPADAARRLGAQAPAGFQLYGLLPWKLLEIELIPVARRRGFLQEVRPLIAEVHRLAAAAAAGSDPAGYLRREAAAARAALRPSPAAETEDGPGEPGASEAEVQDLFAALEATEPRPPGDSTAPEPR